jgi:hypothetical protein
MIVFGWQASVVLDQCRLNRLFHRFGQFSEVIRSEIIAGDIWERLYLVSRLTQPRLGVKTHSYPPDEYYSIAHMIRSGSDFSKMF